MCIGEVENLNFFSAGSDFTSQIFTEEFSRVDSVGVLKQGVLGAHTLHKKIADTSIADICYSGHFFWAPHEQFGKNFPVNSGHPMIRWEKRKYAYF